MEKEQLNLFKHETENKARVPRRVDVGVMPPYDAIYADPPWCYKNASPPCLPEKQPDTCKIEYYYKTMTIDEIKKMNVSFIASQNAVLFIWATTPAIEWAFDVLREWGFKYKTMITWEKTNNDCMGYWFRVCTEHLIIAIRGKVKAFRSMERTLYRSPRGKHSEKPDYFYSLIESVVPGPKIELFARKRREGWAAFGNEIESDIELTA